MMSHSAPSTWRGPILAQFTPDIAAVARLTVVADPDELLTEQGVIDGIRQRGLPEDYLALIAPCLRAFIGEGKRTVAHGGICIEEAIVPFVTITRAE